MAYIFVDESGQFQKHEHNNYFIICSFLVADPRRTRKKFLSWRQSKYPKKMAVQSEIKYADSHIHPSLRKKTVQFLGKLDLKIRYSYLNVKNIPFKYRTGDTLLEGNLYAHIVAETLATYFPLEERQIFIYCDQRKLKGLSKAKFATLVKTHLLPLAQNNSQIFVEMVDSTSSINIQIADWLAGIFAGYHNEKPSEIEYIQYIKRCVVGYKEFFKKY